MPGQKVKKILFKFSIDERVGTYGTVWYLYLAGLRIQIRTRSENFHRILPWLCEVVKTSRVQKFFKLSFFKLSGKFVHFQIKYQHKNI